MNTKWKDKKYCLRPDCGKWAVSRGLCYEDYKMAFRIVMEGKKTWEQLESEGKSLPKGQTGRKPSDSRKWFLGE